MQLTRSLSQFTPATWELDEWNMLSGPKRFAQVTHTHSPFFNAALRVCHSCGVRGGGRGGAGAGAGRGIADSGAECLLPQVLSVDPTHQSPQHLPPRPLVSHRQSRHTRIQLLPAEQVGYMLCSLFEVVGQWLSGLRIFFGVAEPPCRSWGQCAGSHWRCAWWRR